MKVYLGWLKEFSKKCSVEIHTSQLKSMVESMQLLQYANIGVAIAGIGVSVIGFAIVNKRLKGIETQVAKMIERMDRHFQALYERELRQHFSHMYVLFEKAELAHTLTSSTDEWLRVASQLADEGGFFEVNYHSCLIRKNLK